MSIPKLKHFRPGILFDNDGNVIGSSLSAGARLLVDAIFGGLSPAVRNADNDDDFAAALLGFVENSRLGALGATDYVRLLARAPNVAVSESLEGYLMARAAVSGRDLSATAAAQIIQAGLASQGMGGVGGLYTAEARGGLYVSSEQGRRFIATKATIGASLTAQAAFVATTPTLLLRQSSGSRTVIVREITIMNRNATPSPFTVGVVLDPDDRFSAGGTVVTPQNPNEGSAAASGITDFRENPTATAADADERNIVNMDVRGLISIDFADELILSGTGSILVYVFDPAGLVAPVITYSVDWEEHA